MLEYQPGEGGTASLRVGTQNKTTEPRFCATTALSRCSCWFTAPCLQDAFHGLDMLKPTAPTGNVPLTAHILRVLGSVTAPLFSSLQPQLRKSVLQWVPKTRVSVPPPGRTTIASQGEEYSFSYIAGIESKLSKYKIWPEDIPCIHFCSIDLTSLQFFFTSVIWQKMPSSPGAVVLVLQHACFLLFLCSG